MTENQADRMLESLQKIEGFLEAIDWKLWNLHEKFMDDVPVENKDSGASNPAVVTLTKK